MGILNSKGTICIFIDSGTVIDPDCITAHILSHKEKHIATIGYVYGFDNTNENAEEIMRLIDLDNIRDSIELLKQNNIFDMREPVYTDLGDDLTKWPAPWCYFWSVNISVERQDLLNVGIFDESHIQWGGEDVDLGIALFINGVKINMCRSASSIHLPHKKFHNITEDFEEFKKELVQTRLKLFEKYKLQEILVWTKVLDSTKFNRYLLEHTEEWKDNDATRTIHLQ